MKTATTKPAINKDTLFLCPGCNRELGRARIDIFTGMSMMASHFEAIPPQTIRPAERMISHCCSLEYFSGGMLFTKDGWSPNK